MARLPYVHDPAAAREAGRSAIVPDGAAADVAAAYEEVRALDRPLLNLYRILANQPAALRAFLRMSRYVRSESGLPAQIRELAILATAYALGVRYEQVHHTAAARSAGVAEQKLAAFPAWQAGTVFTPAERAAMAYAREVAVSRRVGDATFSALRTHFPPAQIVDLALTVGWYHLCAALLIPLDVDLEE